MVKKLGGLKRMMAMAAMLCLVAFAMMGTTCRQSGAREGRYLVPEEDTARDQFQVAEQQLLQAQGVVDKGARREEIIKSIRAYEAVETRFPEDTRFTPAAALFVGHLYRLELQEYNKAITQYKHVIEKYPNQDDVRIESLFGIGVSYNETNRPAEAQVYFKQLLDEYSTTRDAQFRDIVERTRTLYRQVRTLTE